MNRISFTGRVVADAELRYAPDSTAVCNFRVASDVGFGDKKVTNWLNCQVWGKRAESIHKLLLKGQQITGFGTITLREWSDRDGAKKISPDVRMDDIELTGSKQAHVNNAPADHDDMNDPIPL